MWGVIMLAVKFYSTMPSDNEDVLKGINRNIPAIVINLDVTPDAIVDETYTQMTQAEYNAYLIGIQFELEAWKAIQEN